MLKKLLIPTAVCAALASSNLIAETATDRRADPSQTTGQQQERSTTGGQRAGSSPQGLNFDQLDRNQDGKLDEDELNRYGSPAAGVPRSDSNEQGEQLLKLYDHDSDGAVTKEEMERGPRSERDAGDN